VFYAFSSTGARSSNAATARAALAALMYARAELGREMTMESAGGVVHARVRKMAWCRSLGYQTSSRLLADEARAEMPFNSLEIDGADIEFGAVSMGNPMWCCAYPM